jgi:hypothetical protein
MNVYTVRDNLKKTIANKQAMLNGLRKSDEEGYYIITQWLEINIDELQKILADVEICCTQATEASWALNPERMGQ